MAAADWLLQPSPQTMFKPSVAAIILHPTACCNCIAGNGTAPHMFTAGIVSWLLGCFFPAVFSFHVLYRIARDPGPSPWLLAPANQCGSSGPWTSGLNTHVRHAAATLHFPALITLTIIISHGRCRPYIIDSQSSTSHTTSICHVGLNTDSIATCRKPDCPMDDRFAYLCVMGNVGVSQCLAEYEHTGRHDARRDEIRWASLQKKRHTNV